MKNDKERIVLGSGDIYVTDYDGEAIPDDKTLEVENNRLGHIKGGASLEYTAEFYEAKDDFGKVCKTIITEEEATLSSGLITWNGTTLAKMCATARVSDEETKRTVKIGGMANYDSKKYVIRFVHKDKADGDVRVTIVGNNQSGFTLAFAKDAETVVDAQFKALPSDAEGTLIIYEESDPAQD